MRTCREDCEAVPPTPALRLSFREVSDRAGGNKVCCAGDFLVVWTIVLAWRRRDSELLYDRAHCGRLRALCFAALHLFVGVGIGARVGRARVFRRPKGLTRCEPRANGRASLLLRPIRPPPHPRAPSHPATRRDDERAEFGARERDLARSSPHASSMTQSDFVTQLQRACATTVDARSAGVTAQMLRGGSERSATRSPCA
jgi:hypothetical protein